MDKMYNSLKQFPHQALIVFCFKSELRRFNKICEMRRSMKTSHNSTSGQCPKNIHPRIHNNILY